jgi:hypothetical protein
MTQPELFHQTLTTLGTLEHIDNHYVTVCCCGAEVRTPADVGLATAGCTLRYDGWRRLKDQGWRCPRCQGLAETAGQTKETR